MLSSTRLLSIARFRVLRIINEPTAAAIALGYDKEITENGSIWVVVLSMWVLWAWAILFSMWNHLLSATAYLKLTTSAVNEQELTRSVHVRSTIHRTRTELEHIFSISIRGVFLSFELTQQTLLGHRMLNFVHLNQHIWLNVNTSTKFNNNHSPPKTSFFYSN